MLVIMLSTCVSSPHSGVNQNSFLFRNNFAVIISLSWPPLPPSEHSRLRDSLRRSGLSPHHNTTHQWSYYSMTKFKSAESPQCNTRTTSKASKGKWWNCELLAELLVCYPGKDHCNSQITEYSQTFNCSYNTCWCKLGTFSNFMHAQSFWKNLFIMNHQMFAKN